MSMQGCTMHVAVAVIPPRVIGIHSVICRGNVNVAAGSSQGQKGQKDGIHGAMAAQARLEAL